jgi:hypothetical protein
MFVNRINNMTRKRDKTGLKVINHKLKLREREREGEREKDK